MAANTHWRFGGPAKKEPRYVRRAKKGNFEINIQNTSNRKLQDWNGGLADIYDDVDIIALYMLAAPDSVQLTDEFEKVLDFHDPSVAHHEELLA